MDLTRENKKRIDSMTYKQLLSGWRFTVSGDPWFQGETGDYWSKRMAALRNRENVDPVKTSKTIGWGGRSYDD